MNCNISAPPSNTLLCFDRLHTELICTTFYFAVYAGHYAHCKSHRSYFRTCRKDCPLDVILAVCKRWRELALAYPPLWSQICALCLVNDRRYVNRYIPHAGSRPYDLLFPISTYHSSAAVDRFQSWLCKTKSVRICLSDAIDLPLPSIHSPAVHQIVNQPMPSLTSLDISHMRVTWNDSLTHHLSVAISELQTPNLRSLSLDGMRIDTSGATRLDHTLPRLTRLALASLPFGDTSFSIRSLLQLFSNLSKLEVLVLDQAIPSISEKLVDGIRTTSVVTMPCLRVLCVQDHLLGIVDLLLQLQTPSIAVCKVWALTEPSQPEDTIRHATKQLISCPLVKSVKARMTPTIVDVAFSFARFFSIEWACDTSRNRHAWYGRWPSITSPRFNRLYDDMVETIPDSSLTLCFTHKPSFYLEFDNHLRSIESALRSVVLSEPFPRPVNILFLSGRDNESLASYLHSIPANQVKINCPSHVLPSWASDRYVLAPLESWEPVPKKVEYDYVSILPVES